MDRRGFLKRCSLIPFVGSLAAVAEAEEPKKDWLESDPLFGIFAGTYRGNPIHRPYNCSICRAKEVCKIQDENPDDYILTEKEYQKVLLKLRQKDNLIELEFGNPEHAELPGARAWLDECKDRLNDEFYPRAKDCFPLVSEANAAKLELAYVKEWGTDIIHILNEQQRS